MQASKRRLVVPMAGAMLLAACGIVSGGDDAVWVLDGNITTVATNESEYEPSPDGEWVAFFSSGGSTCAAPTATVGERRLAEIAEGVQCFETIGSNVAWAPDSSALVSSGTNRQYRRGPVDVLRLDGSRTRVVDALEESGPTFWDPDAELEVVPYVVDAAWLDAETVLYVELVTREDFSEEQVAFVVSADGGDPTELFEPDEDEELLSSRWTVDITSEWVIRATGSDGDTTTIVDGHGTTTVATPEFLHYLSIRSASEGSAVVRDGSLDDVGRGGPGSGWWLIDRGSSEVMELKPAGSDVTRIVDVVLSPNGSTLAVISEQPSGQVLSLVSVASATTADGVIDLAAGLRIETDAPLVTGVELSSGPLRWGDDRRLFVLADELLLEFGVEPA